MRAMAVKLWPRPTTFTVLASAAACFTMAASSSSVAGRWTASGWASWLPAQFLQTAAFGQRRRDACAPPAREAPATSRSRVRRTEGPTSETIKAALQGLDQLGQDLVDVADDAEVGDREDRRLLVLVDGDDVLRALHAHHVLRGARDAGGDVHGGLHDLARLADLVAVGHPAGVDDGSGRARRALQQLGQLLDHLVLAGLAEAAAAGDDHGGLVELGSRGLLDVARRRPWPRRLRPGRARPARRPRRHRRRPPRPRTTSAGTTPDAAPRR